MTLQKQEAVRFNAGMDTLARRLGERWKFVIAAAWQDGFVTARLRVTRLRLGSDAAELNRHPEHQNVQRQATEQRHFEPSHMTADSRGRAEFPRGRRLVR